MIDRTTTDCPVASEPAVDNLCMHQRRLTQFGSSHKQQIDQASLCQMQHQVLEKHISKAQGTSLAIMQAVGQSLLPPPPHNGTHLT